MFVLAVGAQVTLNTILYRKPSLQGQHPPFLTARLIVDGPGRRYLEKNCSDSKWEVCRYSNNLSGSSDRFLWSSDGVWSVVRWLSRADAQPGCSLRDGRHPRIPPREQFLRSSVNVLTQLEYYDLVGFGLSSDAGAEMHKAFPQAETSYLHSRQAHDNLPLHFFNWVHRAGVVASLIVVAVLLPWLWRVRPRSLIALGFVIAVCIGANALSAATLSGVNGRYGSR